MKIHNINNILILFALSVLYIIYVQIIIYAALIDFINIIDWVQRKLKGISKITTGGTPNTNNIDFWQPHEISWMSSGEVNNKRIKETEKKISRVGLTNSSAKIIEERSVLIALAGQGKTRGKVAINEIPLSTNQSIAAITPVNELDTDFLYYNLEKRYLELRSISSGDGSRGGLNKKILEEISVLMPNLNEQIKISIILNQIDKAIALHQEKIKLKEILKNNLLINLFTYNHNIHPIYMYGNKLDKWTNYKLIDLLSVNCEKNKELFYTKNSVLSVSRTHGTINQIEFQGRSFASNNLSNYKVVKKGQIIYTKSPLKGAEYGIFKYSTLNGIVSPLYAVYTTKKDIEAKYIHHYFSVENRLNKYLAPLISKGAKNTINITDTDALMGYINIPSITKQRDISSLLDIIDHDIKKNNIKIDIYIYKLKVHF